MKIKNPYFVHPYNNFYVAVNNLIVEKLQNTNVEYFSAIQIVNFLKTKEAELAALFDPIKSELSQDSNYDTLFDGTIQQIIQNIGGENKW